MNNDQVRFKKLHEYSNQLSNRYLLVLSSNKILNELNKMSVINIVGRKKAESNVKVFNQYRYYFLTSKEAVRCFLLIELAKFFDEDKRKQALSIQNVIHFAEKRIESFSTEEFIKFHKDRKIIPELFERFKPLSQTDLNIIKKRLIKNSDSIDRLKKYRDKFLAHDDTKKKIIIINKKDINILFKIIKNAIALFYNRLDFSSNSYMNYEEEPIKEINHLFNALNEHEEQRIAMIKEKYKA